MALALISRTRRSFAFARHMPASKMLRRMELAVKRRLRDRLAVEVRPAPPLVRSGAPPQPVFAPRAKAEPKTLDSGRLRFSFVGRSVDFEQGAMDWAAPGPGPENQLWRMNLHYMEYLETAHDEAWMALVEDWIRVNGAGGPGSWRDSWNSYALSLRVVVWLQELVRRGQRLPEALVSEVEACTVRQLIFLEDNLETDLGGNHLIKNIKALVWAGAYFSGPTAERWRQRGIALLKRELSVQILPDGVHYERSPSYHGQVFADLLECRAALGYDPLSGTLDKTLVQMAQATADLVHPDGHVAQFNDAGLTMSYTPGECLAAYTGLGFERPDNRRQFAYPDAGYFGLRSGETYFVFDCGAIAPDDLPAHGHGDVLSFEWSVAGRRVIVDQGVYEYVEGPRRAASRSAAQHNTLCLEGTDQADFFGAFRCGRRPRVDLLAHEASEASLMVEGRHDGFTASPGGPFHSRRFEVSKTDIVIRDQLAPTTSRAATVSMLLHPEVAAEREGASVTLSCGAIRIAVEASHPLAIVPAVWWPDMGTEIATARLQMTLPAGTAASEIALRVVACGTDELEPSFETD